MTELYDMLINYGYWGMLAAAFLAGSIVPFSSEAVMAALETAGLSPTLLLIYGTIGNTLGSMLNYGIGRLGKMEWIESYLHIRPQKIERMNRLLEKRGAWMGFLAVLPFAGGPLAVALGLMRANIPITVTSMTIGKAARYALLLKGVSIII